MGCIYKITNSKNGKAYIGLTTRTAEIRFKKHKSMIKSFGCVALYGAMHKHGVEYFETETIYETSDKTELMEKEKFYIEFFNTLAPNGYNLTTGGEDCNVLQATKDKISLAMKGREILWKDKISESVKKLWEDDDYRTAQTLERHKKRGKYREGIVRPLRKELPIDKINEMYLDGKSINQIAIYFGVAYTTIKRRIKNE